MTVTDPDFVTILVLTMAAFIVAQTLVVSATLALLSRRMQRMEQMVGRLMVGTGNVLSTVRGVTEKLEWVHDVLPGLEGKSESGIESVLDGIGRANETMAEKIEEAIDRLENGGRKLEYGLTQVARQANQLDRLIQRPGGQVGAVIHGFVVGFRELFRKEDRWRPATHSSDEDDFI